jgi:hypothetical protein
MRSEEELNFLEKHIPDLAETALHKAYIDALSLGHSVLQSHQGQLIEVSPDGNYRTLGSLPDRIPVDPSKKLRIVKNS